jgi:hypothetical protein
MALAGSLPRTATDVSERVTPARTHFARPHSRVPRRQTTPVHHSSSRQAQVSSDGLRLFALQQTMKRGSATLQQL